MNMSDPLTDKLTVLREVLEEIREEDFPEAMHVVSSEAMRRKWREPVYEPKREEDNNVTT